MISRDIDRNEKKGGRKRKERPSIPDVQSACRPTPRRLRSTRPSYRRWGQWIVSFAPIFLVWQNKRKNKKSNLLNIFIFVGAEFYQANTELLAAAHKVQLAILSTQVAYTLAIPKKKNKLFSFFWLGLSNLTTRSFLRCPHNPPHPVHHLFFFLPPLILRAPKSSSPGV